MLVRQMRHANLTGSALAALAVAATGCGGESSGPTSVTTTTARASGGGGSGGGVEAAYADDQGDFTAKDVVCTTIGRLKFTGKEHDAYRCKILHAVLVNNGAMGRADEVFFESRCVLYIDDTIYDVTPRKREIETTGGQPPRCGIPAQLPPPPKR